MCTSAAILSAGCGLFSAGTPPALPPQTTTLRPPMDNPGPIAVVQIKFDDRGVPHIEGQSEEDLAYGLGFVHARDRSFQIDVLRHAASGRLTELFGDDFLGSDAQLRLLSYRLEEQEQALSPRDLALATAYANGVNAGARHSGPSTEMRLLRRRFEPFTVRDVLALIRLQSFQLSVDFEGELLRERVLIRLPLDDPRRNELVVPVATGDVEIVPLVAPEVDEVSPPSDALVPVPTRELVAPPVNVDDEGEADLELIPLPAIPEDPPSSSLPPTIKASVAAVLSAIGLDVKGASNSWVVDGKHTEDGVPILVNDPHLRHQAPSTFYLAHLVHPEFTVAGATLPGIPGIIIGHSSSLSWGMTTSYVDTQDLVRITVDPARADRYIIDGQPRPFGRWVQRFESGGDIIQTVVWRTTVFGPVLPPSYDILVEPGNVYALMWSAFDPEVNTENLSGFWDLARATNVDAARRALERVGSPSQNVVMATSSGDIAYHLMGKIPRRRSSAPIDRPRDGRTSDAGWLGYITGDEKPSLLNPASGFIVAANQRVSSEPAMARVIGTRGAPPHRALRIHERIGALLDDGAATKESLLAIQHDIESVEARRLAPILGANCPTDIVGHPTSRAEGFCNAIREFDFRYDVNSDGALPFTWMHEALVVEILATHLGTDLALQLKGDPATLGAIEDAILREQNGEQPALLDDLRTSEREGIRGFAARAAAITLDRLVDEMGGNRNDWRWGRWHVLSHRSALGELPVVGGAFRTPETPEMGWRTTVRAEGGIPVRTGAVLRFLAVMRTPVDAGFILDLGQSGHFGHPNAADMRSEWSRGDLVPVATDAAHMTVRATLRLEPTPKPDLPPAGPAGRP